MKVRNKTQEKLIAFLYHLDHGYGKDVPVNPGEIVEVPGPYIGKMENMTGGVGSGNCYLVIASKTTITCHEGPDNGKGYHISKNNPIFLFDQDYGITVRHHSDERDAPIPPNYEEEL